ncbi:hypothetical protein EVAR_96031_1, partial [Eumeta japonica]
WDSPAEIQNLSFAEFKSFIKRKLYGKGHYTVSENLNEKSPWDGTARLSGKFAVRKFLQAVQRSNALKVSLAHRTVSLHFALILSRLLPLDIRVREVAWLYEVKHGKDLGGTFLDWELQKPVYFGNLLHPTQVLEIVY